MRNLIPHFFKNNNENKLICINGGCDKFGVLSSDVITDFALLKFGNGQTQCLPFYRYDETGNRIENITDWGLEQFINHYQTTANPPKGSKPLVGLSSGLSSELITKEAIFHYVYAVLHNPAYRKKYEQNLKRDFPRIPF